MAEPGSDERFGPMARARLLPDRVVEAILAQIRDGRLMPGDRLPGEQALAESLRVSRNVVREAIAQLRSEGVVQSRQGVGAFVAREVPLPVLRVETDLTRNTEAFANLFELRAILEVRAAGLAARRGQATQTALITGALDAMRGSQDLASHGVDADLEFHRAIAVATGNAMMEHFIGFISDNMRATMMAVRKRPDVDLRDIVEVTIAEHAAIHDAILAGDDRAAQAAMHRHIANAARRTGVTLRADI